MESKTNDTSSSIDSQAPTKIDSSSILRETNRTNERKLLRSDPTSSSSTSNISSNDIMELWTWGTQPTRNQLKDCLQILCQEQKRLCGDAAGTTLYSYRFRQRTTILKRYYIAQCRNQSSKWATEKVNSQNVNNPDDHQNVRSTKLESVQSKENIQGGSHGLARLGSRAALR